MTCFSGPYNINADRWIYLNTRSYTTTRFSFNLRSDLGTDIQNTNFNRDKSRLRQAHCHRLIAANFPHPDSKCHPSAAQARLLALRAQRARTRGDPGSSPTRV